MSKHGSVMCHSFSHTIFIHVNEYLHILLAVWYHVNFLEWSTVESFFHSLEGRGGAMFMILWVTDLLHYNARQFISLLNFCGDVISWVLGLSTKIEPPRTMMNPQ